MKTSKKIRLASWCVEKEIQSLAVDANLHDMYGVDNAYAAGASKLRNELREVLEFLKELKPDETRT